VEAMVGKRLAAAYGGNTAAPTGENAAPVGAATGAEQRG
jgi:hypothetical protein